jgi:Beta-propeller repeat
MSFLVFDLGGEMDWPSLAWIKNAMFAFVLVLFGFQSGCGTRQFGLILIDMEAASDWPGLDNVTIRVRGRPEIAPRTYRRDGSEMSRLGYYIDESDSLTLIACMQSLEGSVLGHANILIQANSAHVSLPQVPTIEPGASEDCPSPEGSNWPRQFSADSASIAYGMTTQLDGSLYVAGYTETPPSGDSSAGDRDIVVLKLDASGRLEWKQRSGTASDDVAYAIAGDSQGNAYVAGQTSGSLDASVNVGKSDLFVLKYDNEGRRLWARQLGSEGDDAAYGIKADGADNVFVVGYANGALESAHLGGSDMFVAKFSPSGEKQWLRQFGSAEGDVATAAAVDSGGSVYIAGTTIGSVGEAESAGGSDLVLLKYDAAGQMLWARQFGSVGDDGAMSLCTDSRGNAYIAGYLAVEDDVSHVARNAMVVAKFDNDGTMQWQRQLESLGPVIAAGIAQFADGDIYVTGSTGEMLDGNTSAGGLDMFLVKYSSDGEKKGTVQTGTAADDTSNAIAIDANDDVYIGGSTLGAKRSTEDDSPGLIVIRYDHADNHFSP